MHVTIIGTGYVPDRAGGFLILMSDAPEGRLTAS